MKCLGLTKYVVGANANPPKNPRSSLKNGNVIPMNIVKAAGNLGESISIKSCRPFLQERKEHTNI